MKIDIVVGLGFGDEGKGVVVDYLASQNPHSVVVRFSGGQQAGHTVVRNGIKHTFSNFGSGTLAGVPTYWSKYCTFYLNSIAREYKVLRDKGIDPILTIDPLAKLTTPYDVAYGRMREKILNHGSCGLGIATTQMREKDNYKLYAIDLLNREVLEAKLEQIDRYYRNKLNEEDVDGHYYFETLEKQFEEFNYTQWKRYFNIDSFNHYKNNRDNVIFEGSQGIMLDMDHGIFPNVTYSNTTCKNAIQLVKEWNLNNLWLQGINTYHITRCYQTRHGNGWMSNNDKINLINNEGEINKFNEWQTNFKVGEFDYNLINQGYNIDEIYHNELGGKLNLVVTCLDQRPDWELDKDKLKGIYTDIYTNDSPVGNLRRY